MNNQTVGDSVYMFVQYIKMTNRFLCLWFFYNACKKKAEYTLHQPLHSYNYSTGMIILRSLFVAYLFLIPRLHHFLGPTSLAIIVYCIDLALCSHRYMLIWYSVNCKTAKRCLTP